MRPRTLEMKPLGFTWWLAFFFHFALLSAPHFRSLPAQLESPAPPSGTDVYQTLKTFDLNGGVAEAEGTVLRRDRFEMVFNGTFYFEAPVEGRVRGAVFIGEGTFRCEAPPVEYERDLVYRMVAADSIDSTFRTAVLRFSDDTFDMIGKGLSRDRAPTPSAQKLAGQINSRMLKETGANLAARVAISILNRENPGFFLAEFDKGARDRFTAFIDPQGRLASYTFGVNGGEKGLIFTHLGSAWGTDIWSAFYGQDDYEKGIADYSDTFDLIDIEHYEAQVDVTNPRKRLRVSVRIDFMTKVDGVRAIPLLLSESLLEYESMRLKKGMRLKSASLVDTSGLEALQEDWEGGFTLYLPESVDQGRLSVRLDLEGDYMYDSGLIRDCFYPLSSSEWIPRHGHLDRATFDLTFRHQKKYSVAASGILVDERVAPEDDSEKITHWRVDDPVSLVTFGVGRYERHSEETKLKDGTRLPIEFYSLPGSIVSIKEDFILAEMMNSLNYFNAMFGEYPYSKFGAVFHPRGFGQGFASLLLLPRSDRSSKYTFSFIAHETAHQWWGNVVAWRSYRDQWLSEGFAEYSGILYTALRANAKDSRDLIRGLRRSLKEKPKTRTGIGEGRLADIGPLILGQRLETHETRGAYSTLIYNKGALVLRMLHFLFTNPSSGSGDAFFEMMSDFVRRHSSDPATTESFLSVANEHFVKSHIARKYGLKDLNWFFQQWVYETHLPTYKAEYRLENEPGGAVSVKGTVFQDDAPKHWFMPLPLIFYFKGDQSASGTIHAFGPETPFHVTLPMRPQKVELDPFNWVLSGETRTKKR